jgi:2-methylcitrate dehydratase PrpD
LSAAVAPAALAVAADRGARVGDLLAAFAAGFETMGALARDSHPTLYDGGWHPTAVCGPVGAAVAAAHLLGLDDAGRDSAVGLGLLRSGGLRSAFGSAGKAIQAGMAAASGVAAARLAAAGATVASEHVVWGPGGWAQAFGAPVHRPADQPAIEENWIKAWPCCLQTHGAIDAALQVRDRLPDGEIVVVVHPVSRQAAALDDVADGLQAKFSIPYLTAFALLRGAPGVTDFAAVDDEVRVFAAARIGIRTDAALLESEARLEVGGDEVTRVLAAIGSPQRPLPAERAAEKLRELSGTLLDGVLDDPERPAADVLRAVCDQRS